MRVAMLGLGLIGGSVARAATDGGMTVRAWTPGGSGPERAAGDGITPATSMNDAVADADLVVLAAPPLASLGLVDALAAPSSELPTGAVVTDVTSTKVAIVERARAAGLRFVGGHPLAGREASGYAASDAELFVGRPWVIVSPQPSDADAEARVEALITVCGARAVRMTAAAHDRAVAAISHLPLLVAAALTEAVVDGTDWEAARELAAGGWTSMTRLARGDAEMGAGILATNRVEVASRLRDLLATLDRWATDLEQADPDGLRTRLAAARSALEEAP